MSCGIPAGIPAGLSAQQCEAGGLDLFFVGLPQLGPNGQGEVLGIFARSFATESNFVYMLYLIFIIFLLIVFMILGSLYASRRPAAQFPGQEGTLHTKSCSNQCSLQDGMLAVFFAALWNS